MTGALWHYAVPDRDEPGRWLVVYRVPGTDHWTVVVDCPSEAVALREAERRNPICVPPPVTLLNRSANVHQMPEVVQ